MTRRDAMNTHDLTLPEAERQVVDAANLDDLHDRLESTLRGWRFPPRGPGGERAS